MRPRAPLLVCLVLSLAACPSLRPTEPTPFFGDVSVEQERDMTAEVHRQIRDQLKLVSDPFLLAYVNEVGQRLVAVVEPQPFLYRFALIDDEELNAFTIGGGYVYLSTGVLAQAGDVSELAGVLAHEVAHVRLRHIAKADESRGLTLLSTLAGIAAAAATGEPGILVATQGLNVAMQIKYTREHEAEADQAAIDYLVRAGYDPRGLGRFFQRIAAATPRQTETEKVPPYLFTHPALKERIAAARIEINRSGIAPGLQTQDPRLDHMQARLAMLREPVAGGTGLHRRVTFNRARTDPLLDEARERRRQGDAAGAEKLLARAAELEPSDPRVPLERAQIAREREDPEAARVQLERAFELDPSVPLVAYSLGILHHELGDKARAAYYLEQAAMGFRPRTPGRSRVEFEILRLDHEVFQASGVGSDFGEKADGALPPGSPVVWWGALDRHFALHNPLFIVRFVGPDGRTAHEESVRPSPIGRVSATLDTAQAAPGAWKVRVLVGESPIETRTFSVQGAASSPR